MDQETKIALHALTDSLHTRLRSRGEKPTVEVDMKPVADVLSRMADMIECQSKTLQELIKVLTNHPITVVAPKPEVTVHVPEAKKGEAPAKRKFHITHEDGTKSTVIEG